MKKTILKLGLFLLAVLLQTGCSGDDEEEKINGTIIEETDCGEQINSFFSYELPSSSVYHYSRYFFSTQEEFDYNICYVINSNEEFRNVFRGKSADKVLPEIDFTRYTLIIGQERPDLGYRPKDLIKKYLYETPEGYILELHYNQVVMKKNSVDTFPDYIVYYWGIYPKIKGNIINVKLIIE